MLLQELLTIKIAYDKMKANVTRALADAHASIGIVKLGEFTNHDACDDAIDYLNSVVKSMNEFGGLVGSDEITELPPLPQW